jgi:hypothetical protein
VGVDTHDPTFGRDRMNDPNAILIEERVELRAQRAKGARLHLDKLAIGPNKIDHESTNRNLQTVTGLSQHRFDRSMQRALAQHSDA